VWKVYFCSEHRFAFLHTFIGAVLALLAVPRVVASVVFLVVVVFGAWDRCVPQSAVPL